MPKSYIDVTIAHYHPNFYIKNTEININ